MIAVRVWLFLVAAMVAALVLVGGATRLTGSGLSITEWAPILGVIPPLNGDEWARAFEKYRATPQFRLENADMTLAAFKLIYWWEWTHRFLARAVGFAVLLPALWFWWRGYLHNALVRRIGVLLVLGALQGVLGWYMVKSGLIDRPDVSQYRLAAHLGLAIAIFGLLLWTVLGVGAHHETRDGAHSDVREDAAALPRFAPALTGGAVVAISLAMLIFIQILLGAFVAGLDAGKGYTSWPLMDGAVIPDGLFAISPAWRNLFENPLTVQFFHRMTAYLVIMLTLLHALDQWRLGTPPWSTALLLAVLALGQAALGVWTLTQAAPIDLSLAHQAGALVLFAAAIWHCHRLIYPRIGPG